ncbi:GMC family oxidoreductase N-terminal domain-containing protein [Bernardetia sp. ABR2-2B]|uniref:GMC family oxidoreductase N-terminal domain-containing protein n=1 Tax=Bernardetia sp. ABR2-2B TaxID=3127472 RepID=UPI0030D62202
MKRKRLSKSIDNIKPHYDVVIIGSGYGGSIAASRLSRLGKKVCLLERGKEYLTGEFPDSSSKALPHTQLHYGDIHLGSKTGLYDFWASKDINVVKGCGLGGGSLVNANVSIRPENWVLEDETFPKEIREEVHYKESDLNQGFELATQMLKPNPYPSSFPKLKKLEAFKESARKLNLPFKLANINVNFDINGKNHVGVEQKPCNMCGNCSMGCNQGAKNTTMINYLPDAVTHGASIFTQTSVQYVEKNQTEWVVHFDILETDATHKNMFVRAKTVILAAGTLGSTEIMLRSKQKGLQVSNQIGKHFSGNGDAVSQAYNTSVEINGISTLKPNSKDPVGPSITGIIDIKDAENLEQQMLMEEGTIAQIMSSWLPFTVSGFAATTGVRDSKIDIHQIKRRWQTILQGTHKGATQNTQTLLVMGHDDAGGVLSLKNNSLHMEWESIRTHENQKLANERMHEHTKTLGGTYVPSPTWNKFFKYVATTAHPLGGCAMGEEAQKGVVNHKGQVFSSEEGKAVYDNLYVADGAILPRSLGSNPLLTISALAERICRIMAKEKGWGEIPYIFTANKELPTTNKVENNSSKKQIDEIDLKEIQEENLVKKEYTETLSNKVYSKTIFSKAKGMQAEQTQVSFLEKEVKTTPSSKAEISDTSNKLGISFTETMKGYFSTSEKEDYKKAYKEGKKKKSILSTTLTIICNDVEFMVKDKNHSSSFIGTMTIPTLSDQPFTILGGKFGLFVESKEEMETKYMRYTSKLFDHDGKVFFFEGFKIIQPKAIWKAWKDTTTLHVTIYEGDSAKGKVAGKGIIRIFVSEFIKQLYSMRALHTTKISQKTKALYTFLNFFTMSIFQTYGGVLAPNQNYNARTQERKKRELHAPAPTFHDFTTSDGLNLKLTRYQGGTKGPILLSHGFSVSGKIFQIDTIEKNMVEYLCENNYDVWIMEYRTSIELESSFDQCTADDIALKDYPAAVEKVLEITQKKNLQILSHCVGTLTALMAIMGGLKGVRSLLCMQVGTDVIGGTQVKLKALARVPTLLKKIGGKRITAYTDSDAGFWDNLLNFGVRIYSTVIGAGTKDPIANRVTFMFSKLYQKKNINPNTFKAFHEMFGVANFTTYEQLNTFALKKEIRNAKGEDTYLPHAKERLNIPICFIHGEYNKVFNPKATKKSQERLQKLNPKQEYTRCLIEGYGHQDCIIGNNAYKDVFPHIIAHFDKTN